MPRNGSGTYTLPPIYLAQSGTEIQSIQHNSPLEDLASAMTNSLPRDGQGAMTGNLPMGNNRITGMADGIASSDAATVGQTVRNEGWAAILADLTPAANAVPYATGQFTGALMPTTAFGRGIVNVADAVAGRAVIGLTLNEFALARLNESQSFGLPVWTAGTETRPGIPTPAQVRANASKAADDRALGRGQTWQNVASARVAGTIYTNDTDRPIQLSLRGSANGWALEVRPDAAGTWVPVAIGDSAAWPQVQVIIPIGAQYRHTGGPTTLSLWTELR